MTPASTRWPAGLLAIALALGACSSGKDATPVTGLGATSAAWQAHHDSRFSSAVLDSSGRVTGYVLTLPSANTLDQAVALVRKDLPPDSTASAPQLVIGIEKTHCEVVVFTSPTLRRLLGGDGAEQVLAAFQADNSNIMDTSDIRRGVVLAGGKDQPHQC